MELDFSYVRCWFNICFLNSGKIIITEPMVCGLEIEQLWCCVVGIINYKVEYLAAILGFICADEAGKTAGWH